MRLHRDERGQTIILVALSLPLLLGFVGIATDVGALFKDKRTMQTAADAGAIAGALNLTYGNFADAAKAATASNGYTDGVAGVTVTVPPTPNWAPSNYYHQTGYVEVTIQKTESTIFLSLFGRPSVTVLARAVATNQAAGSGCLYSVGSSGTGFTNNGTVNVNATSCGLIVDSSDPSAMVLNGHSDTVNLGAIGVVGGYVGDGSPTVNPTPVTGVAPESDPLNYLPQFTFTSTTTGKGKKASTTTTMACASGYDTACSKITIPTTCATTGSATSTTYNVAPGATLSPGCYAGLTFPSSGTVTLDPGVYFVAGDLTFGGGNVNGTGGVTFYWGSTDGKNGNISFGSGTYDLVAPNDKTQLYNGVLLAESISDTNNISFGGNSSTTIQGVVYAPGTSFSMAGTPDITLDADFVVHDITLSGNVTFTSYDSLSGISSPLNSVALVE